MELRRIDAVKSLFSTDFLFAIISIGLAIYLWNKIIGWSMLILWGPLGIGIAIILSAWLNSITTFNLKKLDIHLDLSRESQLANQYGLYAFFGELLGLYLWKILLIRDLTTYRYATGILMLIFHTLNFAILFWMMVIMGRHSQISLLTTTKSNKYLEENKVIFWNGKNPLFIRPIFIINFLFFILTSIIGILISTMSPQFQFWELIIEFPYIGLENLTISWTNFWYLSLCVHIASFIAIIIRKIQLLHKLTHEKLINMITEETLIPREILVTNLT